MSAQNNNFSVCFSGGKDSTAMLLRLVEEGCRPRRVVWFDGGWEFPAMARHVSKVEKFTGVQIERLHPARDFFHWFADHPVVARKGERKGECTMLGVGWPSPSRRWCTRIKAATIDKALRGELRAVGFSADEAHRINRPTFAAKGIRAFYPLVDWGMTGTDCLAFCRDRGFDWGGLYQDFTRVSCWCCPLQRLSNLRTLRANYPILWRRLLRMDALMRGRKTGFRGYDTVMDIDTRFLCGG